MARRLAFVVALSLVASLAMPAQAAAAPPSRYIVVYRDTTDADSTTNELERNAGFHTEFRYAYALRGFAARLAAPQLARVRADPRVAFISPDRVLAASDQVPLLPGDSAPTGVRRIGAATTTTANRPADVSVAVIDTGISLQHPDLNAVSGTNCIRKNTAASDDNGHGTHVAGSIAAKNNGSGVVGVAPGTKLYAVKVLDSKGSGTDAQVICGIDWVTANASALNIKVANMSLGGPGSDDGNCGRTNADALHAAICRSVAAGVSYVVAAGNSSADLAGSVPANYDEALAVTAIADYDGLPGGVGAPNCLDGFFNADDSAAYFSNFSGGQDDAHVIAGPGTCITSTWPGGGYQTISGTSMATPHVAGAVALCFGTGGHAGRCASLSPAQVIARMRADAAAHTTADPSSGFAGDPTQPFAGALYGYLVWAGAADTTPPVISLVRATSVGFSSATIEWNTDELADGQVEYGRTTAYGSATVVAPTLVRAHAIGLAGLTATTAYHFHVKSHDAWGNLAVSNDATFTTVAFLPDLVLAGGATPPTLTTGEPLTYDLALQNKGPAPASGVSVALALPAGTSVLSSSASQGSCAPSASGVSCSLGTLGVGAAGQILIDQPSGFWRLGEAPGATTAADASGSGNAGTYEPGVALGQAGALPGDSAAGFSGAAVSIPYALGLDRTQSFSLEAWVRPTAAGENGGIVEKTVGGAVNTQYLLFLEAGTLKLRAKPAATAYVSVVGPLLPLNSWSHVVGTYDGQTLRLYLNGALVGSAAALAPLGGGSGVTLIGRLGSGIFGFSGTLDEVAIFPQALSAERIRAHYQGGAALHVVVAAGAAGSFSATATASATEVDPDPTTNTLTFTTTVH